jgi:hypothetical protein
MRSISYHAVSQTKRVVANPLRGDRPAFVCGEELMTEALPLPAGAHEGRGDKAEEDRQTEQLCVKPHLKTP